MAGEPATAIADAPPDGGQPGDIGFSEFATHELESQLDDLTGEGGDGSQQSPTDHQAPDPTGQLPPAEGVAPDDQRPPTGEPAATDPAAATDHPLTNLRNLLGTDGLALPDGMAQEIGQALDKYEAYTQEVATYVQQVEAAAQAADERNQQATQVVEYFERLASDPRFKQALASITGKPAPGPNGAAGGPGSAATPARPDFDSEGESYLDEQQRALAERTALAEQQLQELQQQLATQQEAAANQHRQELLTRNDREIESAHQELDKTFPALAADPATRRKWHDKAADMYEIQAKRRGGPPPSIRQALLDAGKLLTYDSQRTEGGKSALDAARRAAAAATRAPGRSARTAGEQTGGSTRLADIAREIRAEQGV